VDLNETTFARTVLPFKFPLSGQVSLLFLLLLLVFLARF